MDRSGTPRECRAPSDARSARSFGGSPARFLLFASSAAVYQWNFDVLDDSLLVWNNAVQVNVGSALEGRALTTAWISQHEVIARLVVIEAG